MKSHFLNLIFLGFWFYSGVILANDLATFGPEFEFTSQKIDELWANPKNYKSTPGHIGFWVERERIDAKRLMWEVKKLCPTLKCRIEKTHYKHGDEYLVIFEDGLWVRISYDPAVVEIQMKPQTLAELKRNKSRLQTVIFDAAKATGLYLDHGHSAGHFNIGFFSFFGRDFKSVRRFMSFLVDLENNPELFLGALGDSLPSAKTFSQQKYSQRVLFGNIAEISNIHHLTSERNIEIFLNYVLKKVLEAQKRPHLKNTNNRRDSLHNQAVNLEDIYRHIYALLHPESADVRSNMNSDVEAKGLEPTPTDRPIELRGIRAQRSIHEFILLAELFKLRMKYLESYDLPILYAARSIKNPSPQEIVTRFYIYVTESGGSFHKFKILLPRELRNVPIDPFISGEKAILETESDYITLKKHLPLFFTSKHVHDVITNVIQTAIESKRANKWISALLRDFSFEAARLKDIQPSHGILFQYHAVESLLNMKKAIYIAGTLRPKSNQLKTFFERVQRTGLFYSSYHQQLHASCENFFK